MPLPMRSMLGLISLLGLLGGGCRAPQTVPYMDEEEDVEARATQELLMTNRARLEAKGGIVMPINDRFNSTWGAGIKGQIEAVEKGIWFGLEFDFANIESSDPLERPAQADDAAQAAAKTEERIKDMDRYQVLFTLDYELPLADGPYWPSFHFGVGLGGVIINPHGAEGNPPDMELQNVYMFVAQPSLGFRFPFHENIGAFIEAEYNFIPKVHVTGDFREENDVDIGNKVEFSTINLWAGLSFQW